MFNKYFRVSLSCINADSYFQTLIQIIFTDDLHFCPSSTEWESVCKNWWAINIRISHQTVNELQNWEHLIPEWGVPKKTNAEIFVWWLQIWNIKLQILNHLEIPWPLYNFDKICRNDTNVINVVRTMICSYSLFFLILNIENHIAILSLFHVLQSFNF